MRALYYIVMTLMAGCFIMIGWGQIEGGYLWMFSLVAGGVVMGHVLTEALNEPEQEKTNDARYI